MGRTAFTPDALEVLTTQRTPIKAVALVNPAVRIRSAIGVIEAGSGQTYPWTAESHKTADELDFVARVAGGVTACTDTSPEPDRSRRSTTS